MKTLAIAAATATAVALLLVGCTAASAEPDVTPSPSTSPGAATIQEVWAEIGCKENDPLGSRGILDRSPPTAPVEHTGTCTPYEDGDLVFFYQLPSAAAGAEWLDSGGLEIGATDAVFTDGAVVILVTDAGTAQQFAGIFTPHE